ncbi:MAG: transglycosylase SLT domain-containing protein [candidate division Zixibacteria bacterium]|nr:transglycosylase SLT domain-containing protein [candidate division Zixibacteria bacterium]
MSASPIFAQPAIHPTKLNQLTTGKANTLDQEKTRLKKATKEFESFFLYYMLKTMRSSIPKDPLTKDTPFADGLGKETFTDMFDSEISKSLSISSGNSSISNMLYKSMEKVVEARFNNPESPTIKTLHEPHETTLSPLRGQPICLPQNGGSPIPIENKQEAFPMSRHITEPQPIQTITSQPSGDAITSRYKDIIDEASDATKLDSALIAAVINVESGGNPNAMSPRGAAGLMQLIESTAKELDVKDRLNPRENINGGSRYLRKMLDRFGDLKLALAAYNAGPGAVEKHGGIPPYPETVSYVDKVTKLYHANQTLYSHLELKVKTK